jgi:hypothetical protein
MSSRTGLLVVLRFDVEESKPRQCDPERDRSQELDRANADRRRSPSGGMPGLQGRELPGRGPDPAPRSRRPSAAGARAPWPRRGCRGRRDHGAALPVRALRRRVPCRPSGGAAATAVQRGGDRTRARALGARAGDGARRAASGQPRDGARLRRDGGLGDVATLGEGREAEAPVLLGAGRGAFGDAPGGGGGRGDGARGELGSHDAAPSARAARVPRRCARGVRASAEMRPKPAPT